MLIPTPRVLPSLEHTISQHPAVRQCAVLRYSPERLVGYVAVDHPNGTAEAELRAYLADRLAADMIPTSLVIMSALPLTPDGELDTLRLPAPERVTAHVAPRTATERWLAACWTQLLGVERVGATDSFFGLGGNSLQVIQLIARVRAARGVDLRPRQLYAGPVLEQVARTLDDAGSRAPQSPVRPVPRSGPSPSSVAQDGLWLYHQLDPTNCAYHIGLQLRLRGRLDAVALAAAVHGLVARHEALRTRFVAEAGQPRQVIGPPPTEWSLEAVELAEAQVQGWMDAELKRPFDLAVAPLLRTALARVGPDDQVLLLVVHHIVIDGWSMRILADDLARLYNARSGSTESAMEDLVLQPADHAVWQRERLAAGAWFAQLDFWRDQLAALPTIELPTDRPRPTRRTGAGAVVLVEVPVSLAAAARHYTRSHKVSFLALLQAALLTVLHRYTGRTDLPIGSVFSSRTRPELDPLVGYLATTVVLRTDLGGRPSFAALVKRCHETVMDASANQDVPFQSVVEALGTPHDADRHPLFQISLTLQPSAVAIGGLRFGEVAAEVREVATGYARFEMAIAAIEIPGDRLLLQVEYSTELFAPDRIKRLLDDFTAVLAGGLATPDSSAEDVAIDIGPGGAAAHEPSDQLDGEVAELERLLAAKAELERKLEQKRAARDAARRITPVARDGALICSLQQEAIWFEHQLDPTSAASRIIFALRLHGALDVPALGRALHTLVVRHESLRTRFVERDGLPRQLIDPPPPQRPLPVVDLAGADVQAWMSREIARPMDLTVGPLLRTPLARVGDTEHVLVLDVHHIVADGWSARILAGELSQCYLAATGASDVELPPPAVQAADYAAWQRARLDHTGLQRELDFWRHALADLPTVDLPTDRPRPTDPTGASAASGRRLSDDLAATVRRFGHEHDRSLLAIAHAALLVVLHRYTGQTDLPIGSAFTGRTRVDVESMVGSFVNPMVLRAGIDGDPSFSELVQRCHETVLVATTHQDVPFQLVVNAVGAERVPGRHPLFQINLSLLPSSAALSGPVLGEVVAEPMGVEGEDARFDLAFGISDEPDGRLLLGLSYSIELFDAESAGRLLDHFLVALTTGLADPDAPVSTIDILPADERHRLLRAGNDTATRDVDEPLHHLVEAAAANSPHGLAVLDHDGSSLTYGALDAAANRLAHRLRRHGVDPGDPVGICLPRCSDLVVALLATWKAGGVYLPIDPDLPPERVAFMLDDAAPRTVLTHAEHADRFPACIALDRERAGLAAEPAGPPCPAITVHDVAYIFYTSGSTGRPKGVAVSHSGLRNRIVWMQRTYPLTAADRVLQKTPCGFDVSVWELCWPLAAGATMVLAAPGEHLDPVALAARIAGARVTTLHFVPTMLRSFLDSSPNREALRSVRRVFCSGEALPIDTVRRFLATWPDIELHNLYGPTEASIDVTAWRCEPDPTVVPIGRPIANTRAYVLDERLRPAPTGLPGQLFVAGVGLAHGYLGRPGLTATRFLPDPYGGRPGERMYATGDLARCRADGVLEFLGRLDRQVKLRGQRLEPGEIEHALRSYPGVRDSAVVVRDQTVVGYLVADGPLDDAVLSDVRRFVGERLPVYMIPTVLVELAELPVTANGKLNSAALPAPAPVELRHVPPRTELEHWIAEIWRDLLQVELVGLDDTFFGLGAKSLQIMQLTARIRDQLGVEVQPRHLYTDPTLERLAAHLERSAQQPGEQTDPLVPLGPAQPGGTRPPLYLVHPVGGTVMQYLQLAQRLGVDQPCIAIEDPQLHGGAPAADLVERAARYVSLVRGAQAHGPYLLAGWSLGAAIAVEMASQLTAAGETVALVAVLDAAAEAPDEVPTELETLTWFVVDAVAIAGAALPDVDLDELRALDRDELEARAVEVLVQAGVAGPDDGAELRRRMRAFATNVTQYARYQARPYAGPLALLNARDNPETGDPSGWRSRAPRLEHVVVPGDHYSMLRLPYVRQTAEALRTALDRALARR